jgi:hypothetical protein
MKRYDFLLYDNHTLGLGGRDWAVKAATGQLRDDGAANQKFVDYCRHSFDTRLGMPSNFGAALGGIPLKSGGYLLCVTLETQDLHQRPSCAFVGIHCPQMSALRNLLTLGNPVLSAKNISDGAPGNLELTGAPLVANGLLPEGGRRAGLYQFHQGSTPVNAAEILLKHIEKGTRLPSILGITLWNGNRSQLLRGYDFTFCLGLPASEETRRAERASEDRSGRSASKKASIWPVLVTALCVVFVALIYGFRSSIPALDKSADTQKADNTSPSPQETPTPTATTSPAAKDQPNELALDRPEAFLNHFQELLHHIETAPPQKLKETREWDTLVAVDVLPRFEPGRKTMIELLNTDLPGFKDAVHKENFGYFFEDTQTRTMSAADRAKAIREKAGKISLQKEKEGCRLLGSSFALWTNPNTTTGEWCNLIEDFAKVQ